MIVVEGQGAGWGQSVDRDRGGDPAQAAWAMLTLMR